MDNGAAEPEWTFIGVAPRQEEFREQVYGILSDAGLDGIPESDIKIDTICARGDEEDSVRVWVRTGAETRS